LSVSATASAPRPVTKSEIATVVALTLAALVLRLAGSNSGLWIDEIYSLVDFFRVPLGRMVTAFPRDNHHPLYSALAHLSIAAFGEAPWSIRLPAVLFGTATVPLLYGLGRYVGSRREALLAAALLAVSYHHIWFSQNARGYAMLAFFTIACTWTLLRILDGGPRRLAVLYGASAAFGTYTHLTMVFIVAGHAAVCGALLATPSGRARWSRNRSTILLAFVAAGLGALLLYSPVLLQVQSFFTSRPSNLKGVSTTSWALLETVRVLAMGFGAGNAALGAAVIAAGGALFLVGVMSYLRRNLVALALFVAPVAVIFAGAALARGTFYPRFLFALAGFGVLIGVRGVLVAADWVERRLRPRNTGEARSDRLGTAVMACAILLSCASLVKLYRLPKQDFVGAERHIVSNRAAGESVAVAGAAITAYRDYLHHDWPQVKTAAELNGMRSNHAVWLVYTFPRYLARSAPEVMAIAKQECRDAPEFRGTLGDGDIVVCRLEPLR
jgi:4-amino-4-deoxy-L-arabinose transferase-like glycosyltransferase